LGIGMPELTTELLQEAVKTGNEITETTPADAES
jgi:hypothetical protein